MPALWLDLTHLLLQSAGTALLPWHGLGLSSLLTLAGDGGVPCQDQSLTCLSSQPLGLPHLQAGNSAASHPCLPPNSLLSFKPAHTLHIFLFFFFSWPLLKKN